METKAKKETKTLYDTVCDFAEYINEENNTKREDGFSCVIMCGNKDGHVSMVAGEVGDLIFMMAECMVGNKDLKELLPIARRVARIDKATKQPKDE